MKPEASRTGKQGSADSARTGRVGDAAPATHSRRGLTPEPSPYVESLLETCASVPRLRTFSAAIGTAGLATLLEGDGPITIFAPTDTAFDSMPTEERTALLGDSTRLADLLRHHVVNGRVKAPRATRPRKVTPEFGGDLELTASDGKFHVDDARIVKTNIRASNGVIHAIDRVLDPG